MAEPSLRVRCISSGWTLITRINADGHVGVDGPGEAVPWNDLSAMRLARLAPLGRGWVSVWTGARDAARRGFHHPVVHAQGAYSTRDYWILAALRAGCPGWGGVSVRCARSLAPMPGMARAARRLPAVPQLPGAAPPGSLPP